MEQANFSNQRNAEIILAVSYKHWRANISPILLMIVGGILLFSSKMWGITIGVSLLYFAGTRFLSNKQTSWVLTNDLLIIKSGFLPWKRIYYEVPKEDIYEAYFSQGILDSFFGSATLVIRRTDGLASTIAFKKMTNKEDIIGNINASIREHKKYPQHIASNTSDIVQELRFQNAKSSVADELYKLSILKEKGLISTEEFEAHKRKLIG